MLGGVLPGLGPLDADIDALSGPILAQPGVDGGSHKGQFFDGPTHLRRMTTDFNRKRQISGEKKAEAKGGPPHELELDAEGPGLREWFRQLQKAEEGGVLAGPQGRAAAFDTRLGSALAGGAGYGIAHKLQGHGYGLVKNPEGFILDDAYGPVRAGEIQRAKEWGAQLVRTSVSKNDGWAIRDSGSGE